MKIISEISDLYKYCAYRKSIFTGTLCIYICMYTDRIGQIIIIITLSQSFFYDQQYFQNLYKIYNTNYDIQ